MSCPQAYERAWQSLEGQYDVPNQGFFGIGLGMVAPTILAHATDTAKDAYLQGDVPRRHRRLPAVQRARRRQRPRQPADPAERDGDEWIINGQKVWTSGAQYTDIGEIICRTDPDLPKHKGLTGFVVDMRAPGVEVRPLRQMTGGASFNEVFFTDVRVPDDHRLGDVNQGWTVALTTLMNERASIGAGGAGGGSARVDDPAHRDGAPLRPRRRPDRAPGARRPRHPHAGRRLHEPAGDGQDQVGPAARARDVASPSSPLTQNMMTDWRSSWPTCSAPRIVADTGEWGTYAWAQFVLGIPGMRIAGGSDEVMRNIVGERVLGLPKDAGIDSTTPFRDLKVGTQAK